MEYQINDSRKKACIPYIGLHGGRAQHQADDISTKQLMNMLNITSTGMNATNEATLGNIK